MRCFDKSWGICRSTVLTQTGGTEMDRQLTSKADNLTEQNLNRNALENERRQEREETLKWITDSALDKFRHAWRQ